jgi:hypothetical protein
MILEVALAELSLSFGNGRDDRFERFRCHGPRREKIIQLPLLRDKLVTQRDRLLLHGIEEIPNLDALIRRQVQAIAELKNMARTGISIELGGKSQAHAAPGAKIVDLLVRQGFNRALLKASIWLAGLRTGGVARDDEGGRKQKKGSHDAGSMTSARPVDAGAWDWDQAAASLAG